jgi:hypothetical protein
VTVHATEDFSGDRFEFGANWARFLSFVNDGRIAEAGNSLKDMLGVSDLQGKRFLDIDSGSGLFSMATRRQGAAVHSSTMTSSLWAAPRNLSTDTSRETASEAGRVLCWMGVYLARLGQSDVAIVGVSFGRPQPTVAHLQADLHPPTAVC